MACLKWLRDNVHSLERQSLDPGPDEECEWQAIVGRRIVEVSRDQVPGSSDMRPVLFAASRLSWMLLIAVPSLAAAHDCWLQADEYQLSSRRQAGRASQHR